MSGASAALVEQLAFYRAVADEYEDHTIDLPGEDELLSAIDSFRPGDVLELACGTGIWTERLLQFGATVTAVDGAAEMLARARSRLGPAASVRFLEADLFSWKADRHYDAVFFGFWISHVPEDKFTSFWTMVAEALTLGGHVFFFDDNYRPEAELIEGVRSPIVQRNSMTARRSGSSKSPTNPPISNSACETCSGTSESPAPPAPSTGAPEFAAEPAIP